MAKALSATKTREARNRAVIERYFHEVLDKKKFHLLRKLMAAEVVLHRPGFAVMGLDSALQRLRNTLQNYTAFRSELSGLMAEGDMVAVRISHQTTVRPHVFRSRAGEAKIGRPQKLNWTAIVQFRLRAGKIVEEWVMRDELGMLTQMGKITVGK